MERETESFYNADKYRDKTRYDYPDTFESETHEDFEPLIWEYVTNNWLPGQRVLTNKHKEEMPLGDYNNVFNPTIPQLVDSARVYNRRKQDVGYQYINPR